MYVFPNFNMQDLNLDWILQQIKNMASAIEEQTTNLETSLATQEQNNQEALNLSQYQSQVVASLLGYFPEDSYDIVWEDNRIVSITFLRDLGDDVDNYCDAWLTENADAISTALENAQAAVTAAGNAAEIAESAVDVFENMVADEYDSTKTYNPGDYSIVEVPDPPDGVTHILYRCITQTTGSFEIDDWAQVAIANDVSNLKNIVNAIANRTGVDYQPPVSFTDGKGVKYLDGALGTSEIRSYSNFINVELFDKIVVTMGAYNVATNYGIAFYANNNPQSFISGVREKWNASSIGVETRTFDIPSTARYTRFTWFYSSSDFYSQFSCHLIKKGSLDDQLDAISNVITENVLDPTEITVGKYIGLSGNMSTSDSYNVTGYIAVKENDQIVLTSGSFSSGRTMRYVTAYNPSKSAVSASGAENVTSYTVPEGIAYVRISASKTILDNDAYARISLNGAAIKYQTYYSGLTSGLAKEDHTNLELFRFYPLSALPEYFMNNLAYKPLGALSKGYICLVSDDGDPGLATYTIPMLITKNVPCTFAVMKGSGCWEDSTNKATILDAIANHGCVIAQHGGITWNQYDELRLNQFFDNEKEFWDSLNVTPYGAVCPQHIINNMIRCVAGGRFGCLRTGYNNGIYYENYTNGARSNLYGLSSQSSLDGSLQDQCNILDYCKANNKLRIIHWHENEMSAADKTQLEGIIDYAKSISLTFITMKDIPNII